MRSHDDRKPVIQFKFPRFVPVWKSTAAPQAKWYGRLAGVAFRETPSRLHIYLSVRGALLWGTGALFSVYLGGTAVLAYVWGQNPYNEITYADLVLPTHWPELRHKRGAGLISQGIHGLRAGDYGGFFLLVRGVNLCPADPRGRMALAEFYFRQGYIHRGLQLLEDGLAFGPPPRLYRESLFRLLIYIEDYGRVLELTDQLEKTLPPGDTATRHWLLAQRVTALEKLHRYDEIERLRDAQQASPSFIVEAAWARAQAAQSRPVEALRAIARDPGRFGPPADRYQLQLDLAVAAGDPATAHAAIRAWQELDPGAALPRIEEIVALIGLGETKDARDHLQRFFLHYATVPPDLMLLFRKLADLPDVRWLQAAYQEADASGAVSPSIRIFYIQGLLMAGKLSEAVTEFRLAKAAFEMAKLNDGGWSDGTGRLINVMLSDSPSNRSLFLQFFQSARLRPDAFHFALKSLASVGAREVAGELAIIARNRFPAMQDAVLLAQPSAAVAQTEDNPSAPAEIHTEAEARLELRRIDAALQSKAYESAFAGLKKLEQASLPALKTDTLTRRIQLLGALGEESELSAALQLYLSGPEANQSWLHQLATQWSGGPRQDSAVTVARETHEKFPQARWTLDLLPAPGLKAPVANAPGKIPGTAASSPTTFTLPVERPVVVIRSEAEARVELRHIDEELVAGHYPAALELIKAVERAKIASLQPELLFRRIQMHGSLGEQTELSAALGYYLSGQVVNQTALRDLAVKWDNDKQRDSALSVTREVLAKFPQARWAADLHKKIEGDLLVAPEKTN